MIRLPLLVFLSHTSELAEEPTSLPFVAAAKLAIERAGHAVVDMGSWTAEDTTSRDACEKALSRCDVYVAILGFRYGSIVANDPSRSYVELEFDSAANVGIPRLVFLVDEQLDVAVSHAFHVDENSFRQDLFRQRVRQENLVYAKIRSPHDLENKLFQSLIELTSKSELNTEPANAGQTVIMLPQRLEYVVQRPALTDEIIAALLSSESGAIVLTTALQGTGGFGKTILAGEICHRAELADRFPAGILWVTIGENLAGADLAAKINDLSLALTGRRPTFVDPEQAGFHLGEILGTMRRLLIVDDVWRISQLQHFLVGGPGCVRLITTRNRGIVPDQAIMITVDAMQPSEAQRLLVNGVGNVEKSLTDELLNLTGRWPVLISLVNGALRRYVRDGDTPDHAAWRVADRLRRGGPTALDVTNPQLRRQAVTATLEASLRLLTPTQLERYLELSIFPDDIEITQDVLETYWGATAGLDALQIEALCLELADLSLVTYSSHPIPSLRLHDVIRSFLRRRCAARLAEMNGVWLEAAAAQFQLNAALPTRRWWMLPPGNYLWDALGYHLLEAHRSDEFKQLAVELRWIVAKILHLSPEAIDADLALVDDPIARVLRRSIGQAAHLLEPFEPKHSVISTLLSRLETVGVIAPIARSFGETVSYPWLESIWPLPDQPHPGMRRVLTRHGGTIWACAVSADGTMVVSGGDGGLVEVWDSRNGHLQHKLEGPTETIYACVFAHDGSWVAAGGRGGTVWLWDVSSGNVVRRINALKGTIYTCALDQTGTLLAVAGEGRMISILDACTGQLYCELAGSADITYCSTFGPAGSELTTSGNDGVIRVWELPSGQSKRVFFDNSDTIYSIAVLSRNSLVSAGYDGILRIWDVDSGAVVTELRGSSGAIYECCASLDGEWVVTAGEDRIACVWEIRNGRLHQEFEGHTGYLTGCAISRDGRWFATAGNDCVVRIWDISEDVETAPPNHSRSVISACAVSPNGDWVVTAGEERHALIWDKASCTVSKVLSGHSGAIEACAINRDGSLIATAGDRGEVRLWRAGSGDLQHTIKAHSGWAMSCDFSPSGEWLATCGIDRAVRIWETSTGELFKYLEGHTEAVVDCRMSPDGYKLASVGYDGTIRIWDIGSGALAQVIDACDGWIYTCSWNFDSSSLATAGDDGAVRIWDLRSGHTWMVLVGHNAPVRACSFNPDGGMLATAGDDQTLRIWDVHTAACLTGIRVEAPLTDVIWVPSGRELCAVGHRGAYLFGLHLQAGVPQLMHDSA